MRLKRASAGVGRLGYQVENYLDRERQRAMEMEREKSAKRVDKQGAAHRRKFQHPGSSSRSVRLAICLSVCLSVFMYVCLFTTSMMVVVVVSVRVLPSSILYEKNSYNIDTNVYLSIYII